MSRSGARCLRRGRGLGKGKSEKNAALQQNVILLQHIGRGRSASAERAGDFGEDAVSGLSAHLTIRAVSQRAAERVQRNCILVQIFIA